MNSANSDLKDVDSKYTAFDMVQWLEYEKVDELGLCYDVSGKPKICERFKQMDMRSFLKFNKPRYNWYDHICEWAAKSNDFEMLKWARNPALRSPSEQLPLGVYPMDVRTVYNWATLNGNLEMLKWARDPKNQPVGENVPRLHLGLCENAAKSGNFEMLKYLRDPTQHADGVACPMDQAKTYINVPSGNKEMKKWVRYAPACEGDIETTAVIYGDDK